MRRILAAIVFVVAGATTGCLTPEAKRQWNEALGDLNGNNTKTIAPLDKKKSTE